MQSQQPAGRVPSLQHLLNLADTPGAVAQILQELDVLAKLRRKVEAHAARSPSSDNNDVHQAVMLLAVIADSGPAAAEQVAAEAGMLPALSRLLARSSTTATAAADATAAFYAATCFARLCDFEVSAQRVAAEPAAVSGLVGLLSMTDAPCISGSCDGEQLSLARQAQEALTRLAVGGGRGAAQLVLQPGIAAALAGLLQPQHSVDAQRGALAVLRATLTALLAGAQEDAGARAAAAQAVQQIAAQPGVAEHASRLLGSNLHDKDVRLSALHLLHCMTYFDSAAARQLLGQPGTTDALVGVLSSKERDERAAAAKVVLHLWEGDVRLLAASCGSSPAVAAAALEAATRLLEPQLISTSLSEPAGGPAGHELMGLPVSAATEMRQQRVQQQLLPEQRGLWLTSLKVAAAGLGGWAPPLQVLSAVCELCKVFAGVEVAGLKVMAASLAAQTGVPEAVCLAAVAEVGKQFDSTTAAGSGSSGSSGSSTAGISGDPAGVLLMGRALLAADRALLQMHEPPCTVATPSDGSSSSSSSSSPGQPWRVAGTEQASANLLSVVIAMPLLGCVALVEPALQQAVTASADADSSSSSSLAASQQSVRDLLHLQRELQSALAACDVAHLGDGSSSSSSTDGAQTAAAEAELKSVLTAAVASQLVALGSGICVQLAAGQHWCCANPGCTSLADASERQLVAGKATCCSGCLSVRLCGPACNKAYWKAGHKQVCALFKQRSGQEQAAAEEA